MLLFDGRTLIKLSYPPDARHITGLGTVPQVCMINVEKEAENNRINGIMRRVVLDAYFRSVGYQTWEPTSDVIPG